MSFSFTRSDYYAKINSGIQGRIGMLTDVNGLMNEAAKEVVTKNDLRSSRRKTTLTPKLFNEVYQFAAPSDFDAYKIIDLPPQVKRNGQEWFLISSEEFDRKKEGLHGYVAIDDFDGVKKILLALDMDDDTRTIASLDSLTSGGGTWSGFGDGENVEVDTDDYVKEYASLRWDIGSGATTTAGIVNTGLNSFDLTNYLGGNGAAFVWAYINSTTNLTNFILRLGSSSGNYYSKTVTAQHDGTAFVAGWNLLRFDLTSLTETGSVTDTAITYAVIYMTKTSGKINETDYRFDSLVLKKGSIYNIKYLSKFPWVSSAGTWKEESTDDTDLLVCETDEQQLFILKGREFASREINEFDMATEYANLYMAEQEKYRLRNPSEVKVMTSQYYEYDQ